MPSYSTGMEKGHNGNASDHCSDANLPGSSFSLDFAGMLDAADSALHQQIYEYLQGPSVQQSDHQQFLSSSQNQAPASAPGNFQGQALYPGPAAGSFAALSPFQTSMPGESLQGTNFVQQRMTPDTSLSHLSRRDGNLDYRRKDSLNAPIGSSAMGIQMLPAGMGSCSNLPAHQQVYSTDVFHPPAQPNMVYNTREFSGYDTSCSPNNLNRPGGESDMMSQHDSRPRGRKAQKIEPGQELLKSQRPAEQAEHIIRERQRRDDMTSKFLMLESLLPPGPKLWLPKRDRSTVVEDSIQYVKSLHHRVKALHEKRSEMKSNAISSQTTDMLKQKTKTTLTNSDPKQNPSTGLGKEVSNPVVFLRSSIASKDNIASTPSESNHALEKTGNIDKIDVHLDLPHQIVIEMTCLPHRHIQSQIMTALERLGMDVSRCSIAKLQSRLICVLVVKPRVMTQPQISGDDVIEALRRAIVPY